jgi:predicted enzyme related to lactoylglutathione lyase
MPARSASKRTKIVGLDHISAPVRDLRAARKFYAAALGAVGMKINMDVGEAFGMGSANQKIFWLTRDKKAAGGQDNGEPGPRPNYGPNYYAAFVKDKEGNNIEVVCYARAPKPRARARTSGASPSRSKRPSSRG